MLLGVTVFSSDRATMCATGLQAGLVDDEMDELEQTGSMRRVYGRTVLTARREDGLIILLLWERRTTCAMPPPSECVPLL